jgi:hypothetical protein
MATTTTATATASLEDIQEFFFSHADCQFVVFDGVEDQAVFTPEEAMCVMAEWAEDEPKSRVCLEAWVDPENTGKRYTLNFNYL